MSRFFGTTVVYCLNDCFLSLLAEGFKFELFLDSSCGLISVTLLTKFFCSDFFIYPLLSRESSLLSSPKSGVFPFCLMYSFGLPSLVLYAADTSPASSIIINFELSVTWLLLRTVIMAYCRASMGLSNFLIASSEIIILR
jgi:hypothetical protein